MALVAVGGLLVKGIEQPAEGSTFDLGLNALDPLGKSASDGLCLKCGLCCNGGLFSNVKLQTGDDAARLKKLGLQVSISLSETRPPRFSQPCAAFDGCRCRIYGERPRYCREFECLLLKKVKKGRVTRLEGLRLIRAARRRLRRVEQLLDELGDSATNVSIGARFRRMKKWAESTGLSGAMAERYGELTLAMQDLNLQLSEVFYPGES
jgi:Fe-S-cluster containining protein